MDHWKTRTPKKKCNEDVHIYQRFRTFLNANHFFFDVRFVLTKMRIHFVLLGCMFTKRKKNVIDQNNTKKNT